MTTTILNESRLECGLCEMSISAPSAVEAESRMKKHRAIWHQLSEPGPGYPCKVEGCAERAGKRSGPTAYLCDQHSQAKRAEIGERNRKAWAKRRGGQQNVPEPSKPSPPATPATRSMDEIVERVRSARRELDEARAECEQAIEELRQELGLDAR